MKIITTRKIAAILLLFSAVLGAYLIGCNEELRQAKLNGVYVPEKFLFVAHANGRPSLYSYDLDTKKIDVFWSSRNENVVNLSYSPRLYDLLFITASSYGRNGIFPFIEGIKLYSVNSTELTVQKTRNLDKAIQLSSGWKNPNLFEIVLNSFDKKRSTVIIQRKIGFNSRGRIVGSTSRKYNLLKENYPDITRNIYEYKFHKGKYKLFTISDKLRNNYFLVGQKEKVLIASSRQQLVKAECTQDGRYLIFSTRDISKSNRSFHTNKPQTSMLFVYSIEHSKLVKTFDGDGYKNFSLFGDLLFFDEGFGNRSKIMIYDLKLNKISGKIALEGGCGISNIPTIPDYN